MAVITNIQQDFYNLNLIIILTMSLHNISLNTRKTQASICMHTVQSQYLVFDRSL